MIVIDSSALAKYILREEGWEEVERRLAASDVYTLDLARKEVLNAVWKGYRRGLFDKPVALEKERALDVLLNAVLYVEEEGRYIREAFRTALDYSVTIYDALFIAQAKAKNAPLLTADLKQAEASRAAGVPAELA